MRHGRMRAAAAALAAALLLGACTAHADEEASAEPESPATLGRWDMIELPGGMEINAIHSVALPTVDVLLIAGSGNDVE